MYAVGNPEAETNSRNELCWFAIVSRSRHEKLAATALANSGITTFLPMAREKHSWSDRHKLVDVPLFPGYVFVQIPNSPEVRLRVLKSSGVIHFVGNRFGAVSIPDKEIVDIRTVLTHKVGCSPYQLLQIGQRVRIRGGALDGVEGVLVGRESDSKLVITIGLIQRSLAVSVYNMDIEPIGIGYTKRHDDSSGVWQPTFGSNGANAQASQS
jgi:transcription termination/antitermination protein NusG